MSNILKAFAILLFIVICVGVGINQDVKSKRKEILKDNCSYQLPEGYYFIFNKKTKEYAIAYQTRTDRILGCDPEYIRYFGKLSRNNNYVSYYSVLEKVITSTDTCELKYQLKYYLNPMVDFEEKHIENVK